MVNFRLKVFRTVAEHLNFRRAAEELCLTQPAVTSQIKTLEDQLGVQIFDRSGARITLTRPGILLLKYAQKIDRLETDALAALSQFASEQKGDLHIGASLTIAQYILPHILAQFLQHHPKTQPRVLTCNTEQVLEALHAREISIGFVEGPTMRRDMRAEKFLEDEIVLIVAPAHEWSERSFIHPHEVKDERLLMREHGSGTRRVIELALQKHGIRARELNIAMEFDSTEGIITAIESGLGIGFASLWSISKELQVKSVRVVPIRGVRITRPLSIVYPLGQEPQGLALPFLQFVRSRRALITPGQRSRRLGSTAAEPR